jgi:hypothetical protein
MLLNTFRSFEASGNWNPISAPITIAAKIHMVWLLRLKAK